MKRRSTISLPVGYLTDPRIPVQYRLLALMASHFPNENFTSAEKMAKALGANGKDPAALVREYRSRLRQDKLLEVVGQRGRAVVYRVNIKEPTQEQLDALNEAVGDEIYVANFEEQKKFAEIPEKDLNGLLLGWNWLPGHAFRDVFPESEKYGSGGNVEPACGFFWEGFKHAVLRTMKRKEAENLPALIVSAVMAIWAMQEIANDKRKGTKVHGAGYLFRKLRRFPKELLADSKFVDKVVHLLSMTSGVPTVASFMDPNTKVPLVPPIISGKIVHDPDEETWERVRKWQSEQGRATQVQQQAAKSGGSRQDGLEGDECEPSVADGETCHACYGAGSYYDEGGQEHICKKCNAWKGKRQQEEQQETPQPNVGGAPPPAVRSEPKPAAGPAGMIPGATPQDYYMTVGACSHDPVTRAKAERKIAERVAARAAASAEPSPTHSACPLCRDSGQWYDRLTGQFHVCHHGEGGAFENQWLNRRATKGNCRLCDDDCYSFDRRLNDQVPCDHDATSPDRCRLDDLTEEESAAYLARIEANQRKTLIEFQRSEELGLPVDQAAVVDGIQPPEIEAGSDDDEDDEDGEDGEDGEELEHPEECECDKCLMVEDEED